MPALRVARFVGPQTFRKGSSLQASRRVQAMTTMVDCKTEGQGSPFPPRYIDVSVFRVFEVSIPTPGILCQSLLTTPGFIK